MKSMRHDEVIDIFREVFFFFLSVRCCYFGSIFYTFTFFYLCANVIEHKQQACFVLHDAGEVVKHVEQGNYSHLAFQSGN